MGCFSLQQTDLSPSSCVRDCKIGQKARVSIIGAGPAGSSAAIAALLTGAPVDVYEQSRFPRHKVCGEFLSPAAADLLDQLGIWADCTHHGAVPITRGSLHFSRFEKRFPLPEPAYGLSRFALDDLLWHRARHLGAEFRLERRHHAPPPLILATGRMSAQLDQTAAPRLFGFKAHFAGPQHDAVELFFGPGVYVGLNVVESGRTNVCGLGRETTLKRCAFDFDAVCDAVPGLRHRLDPLHRETQWFATGPVQFGSPVEAIPGEQTYRTGDRCSFVDPFTGTGITSALYSGMLAGRAAALGLPAADYEAKCRLAFGGMHRVATLLRGALDWPCIDWIAPLLPGALLFRLTRPALRCRNSGSETLNR